MRRKMTSSPELLIVAEAPSPKAVRDFGFANQPVQTVSLDRHQERAYFLAARETLIAQASKEVEKAFVADKRQVLTKTLAELGPAPMGPVKVAVMSAVVLIVLASETVLMSATLDLLTEGLGRLQPLLALAFVAVLTLVFERTGVASALFTRHPHKILASTVLVTIGLGLHRLAVQRLQSDFLASDAESFEAFALGDPLAYWTLIFVLVLFPVLLALVVASILDPVLQSFEIFAAQGRLRRLDRELMRCDANLREHEILLKGISTRLSATAQQLREEMAYEHARGRAKAAKDAQTDSVAMSLMIVAIAGLTLMATAAVVAPWALSSMPSYLAYAAIVGCALMVPALLVLVARRYWRRRETAEESNSSNRLHVVSVAAFLMVGVTLTGCASNSKAAPRQAATVVAIIDTSASMGHVTDAQWRFAVASVVARMQVGDRLCVVPVHSSVHDVDLVGLPCLVREAGRGEVRDADIKRQYQRFWKLLSASLANWRGSGNYSDYQGAIRVAADYFTTRPSQSYLIVLGDLADTQASRKRRTARIRLARDQLKGVEVYLGGTLNTGQFSEFSWRQIEALQNGWVHALEESGATVHLVRSNGFGLLTDWAEARLGPLNPEFAKFHPKGVR